MPNYTGRFLSVKDSLGYLEMNGVDWTETWLRVQISKGHIQSEKNFSSRLVLRSSLDKVIREHKEKKAGAA